MIEIRHVRSGNKPIRNGFATVENWTSRTNRRSISVASSVARIVRMNRRGVSMKSNIAIRLGVAAALLLLAALATPQLAHGQQVTAAITGKVSDPSGAAVPEAKVTATDIERGSVVEYHHQLRRHLQSSPGADRNLQRQSRAHGISSRPAVQPHPGPESGGAPRLSAKGGRRRHVGECHRELLPFCRRIPRR